MLLHFWPLVFIKNNVSAGLFFSPSSISRHTPERVGSVMPHPYFLIRLQLNNLCGYLQGYFSGVSFSPFVPFSHSWKEANFKVVAKPGANIRATSFSSVKTFFSFGRLEKKWPWHEAAVTTHVHIARRPVFLFSKKFKGQRRIFSLLVLKEVERLKWTRVKKVQGIQD